VKLNKNIDRCLKCNTNLQTYFTKSEESWTKKCVYKRCPNCLEIYQIVLTFKVPTFDYYET